MFDEAKVTYNTYSCAISGMSREMMKMDCRDSAEYQIWEKKDIIGILDFDFKSQSDKIVYSVVSPIQKETKNVRKERKEAVSSRSSF